jgi:hypothetical protein
MMLIIINLYMLQDWFSEFRLPEDLVMPIIECDITEQWSLFLSLPLISINRIIFYHYRTAL